MNCSSTKNPLSCPLDAFDAVDHLNAVQGHVEFFGVVNLHSEAHSGQLFEAGRLNANHIEFFARKHL